MHDEMRCPFCGEEIKITAKKCKHCGEWLNYHCPACGELIPETSKVCPICNTPIQKQNKKAWTTVFSVLSILTIFCSFFITLIFALVCMSIEPNEIADFDLKAGMTIFYILFMFIPYVIPITSLCMGFEKKFSTIATVINTTVSIIFLFSLIFAGVVNG